jgi:hypothetical protein
MTLAHEIRVQRRDPASVAPEGKMPDSRMLSVVTVRPARKRNNTNLHYEDQEASSKAIAHQETDEIATDLASACPRRVRQLTVRRFRDRRPLRDVEGHTEGQSESALEGKDPSSRSARSLVRADEYSWYVEAEGSQLRDRLGPVRRVGASRPREPHRGTAVIAGPGDRDDRPGAGGLRDETSRMPSAFRGTNSFRPTAPEGSLEASADALRRSSIYLRIRFGALEIAPANLSSDAAAVRSGRDGLPARAQEAAR